MMIGMALFWSALIVGIVWLVHQGGGYRPPGHQETALTILERRFAEGALSLEDYQQRRNVLTDTSPSRSDRDISSDEKERSKR